MKIEVIYIAGYRHDIRLTRILVASIRHWYPDIPITLVKDELHGRYDTRELERKWGVSLFPPTGARYGWGFGKLAPLLQEEQRRCLVLDSDIVFAGPVLELLEKHEADFVVTHEEPPDAAFVENLYYNRERLRALDPAFVYPGYTFNTGQLVATSGLLRRDDFMELVAWESPPRLLHPEIFKLGEQGLLNYLLAKKMAAGAIALERVRFMETADGVPQVSVEALRRREGNPFVIHWCGLRAPVFSQRPRYDLLRYFEDLYYRRVRGGALRRRLRHAGAALESRARAVARALLKRGRKG